MMDSELTPEEQLLRARARRYTALLHATTEEAIDHHEYLICRLDQERYALSLTELRAVQVTRGLTSLPGMPAFIAGVLLVRGVVVTVIDLAQHLGLGPAVLTAESRVLLVMSPEQGGGLVGLLVASIEGQQAFDPAGFAPAFGEAQTHIGIAAGNIIVLDLRSLLTDSRLLLSEEL